MFCNPSSEYDPHKSRTDSNSCCLISSILRSGEQLGGGRWDVASSPSFHTLAKNMSLNRCVTHFMLVVSHPSYYKYTCAPLAKLPRPCRRLNRKKTIFVKCTLLAHDPPCGFGTIIVFFCFFENCVKEQKPVKYCFCAWFRGLCDSFQTLLHARLSFGTLY